VSRNNITDGLGGASLAGQTYIFANTKVIDCLPGIGSFRKILFHSNTN